MEMHEICALSDKKLSACIVKLPTTATILSPTIKIQGDQKV